MKHRFCTDTIGDFKARSALILDDDTLTDQQRKYQINELRRDAMLRYSFYSTEMRQLDNFIRQRIRGDRYRATTRG